MHRRLIASVVSASALAGCNLFGPPIDEGDFDAPDPASKMYAIDRAERTNDRSKIPQMIECLESDDPAVRFMAIGALKEMTGQTLDYDHGASEPVRRKAVERWRAWAAQNSNTAASSLRSAPDVR